MSVNEIINLNNLTCTQLLTSGEKCLRSSPEPRMPSTYQIANVSIKNLNSIGNVYLGDHDVSSSNYNSVVSANEAISFKTNIKECLFAIADESSSDIKLVSGLGYSTTEDVVQYSPVLSGENLQYSGTPAIGSYLKENEVVTVQIEVSFIDVSNFGNEQYSITIPFNSSCDTEVHGVYVYDVVNELVYDYSLKSYLSASSSVMTIYNTKSSTKNELLSEIPNFSLRNSDKFVIAFTYICE